SLYQSSKITTRGGSISSLRLCPAYVELLSRSISGTSSSSDDCCVTPSPPGASCQLLILLGCILKDLRIEKISSLPLSVAAPSAIRRSYKLALVTKQLPVSA